MKATKIMGAVLVAMLAAALFVGAASAADAGIPTVFVYQNNTGFTGTYYYGANSVTFVNGYISGDNIVEGTYTGKTSDDKILVKYPTAQVKIVMSGNEAASIIGSTVSKDSKINVSTIIANESVKNVGLIFTTPGGVQTTSFGAISWETVNASDNVDISSMDAGIWKVQAFFNTGADGLVDSTPLKYRMGKDVYTFTIADTTNKVAVNTDAIIKGNTFTVTVSGTAGESVTLYSTDSNAANLTVIPGQLNVVGTDLSGVGATVLIGDNGKTTVGIKATKDGKFTIRAKFPTGSDKTVKITVNAGVVTGSAESDFYYLGNDVKLTGTNTESTKIYFYVKGNNVNLQRIGTVTADVASDKTWSKTIPGEAFNNYDAGTYTIYAVADELKGTTSLADQLADATYASISVALKQPFLTAAASASVVAQGSKLKITGTAEAADSLFLYVFGNNKYANETITVDDDGTYEKELKIESAGYATGQYFVVIQHPMYDGKFNIGPVNASDAAENVGKKLSYNITLNTEGAFDAATGNTSVLFNTLKRQSSNAAEALCQALDTQNIDDIYVKLTFIVATPTATMNPVSDVVKGSALKVSGTTNVAAGETVTVELLSTAFAAIPKESVNSASFISLTTKVVEGKDGVNTWEVTFDTTGLNVDEYTLSATVKDVKTSSVTVKVIEGTVTPTAQPTGTATAAPTTTTVPTTTPTKTPGFGALVALAGLGAVAVLLLRRE